jgi:hypothetical protein
VNSQVSTLVSRLSMLSKLHAVWRVNKTKNLQLQ